MKIAIPIVALLVVAGSVISLAPLKSVAYTVEVDYEETETYYEREPYEYVEDEPYEATETYYEYETYDEVETYYEKEPLDYEVVDSYYDTASYNERRQLIIGGVVYQDEVIKVNYPIGFVTVQSTDNESGSVSVEFRFKNASHEYSSVKSFYLKSSETETVSCEARDIDIDEYPWEWDFSVTYAKKIVEKQRTVRKAGLVEKQRPVPQYEQTEIEEPVTRYRAVEKERTVTKQRPETHQKSVTLLDYWLHY